MKPVTNEAGRLITYFANSILQLCFMAWYNCSAYKEGE